MPPPLPPERCALTAPFHPYPAPKRGRYVFCGTGRLAAFTPRSRTLSGTLPCGVRTFLSRTGLRQAGSGRPARLLSLLYASTSSRASKMPTMPDQHDWPDELDALKAAPRHHTLFWKMTLCVCSIRELGQGKQSRFTPIDGQALCTSSVGATSSGATLRVRSWRTAAPPQSLLLDAPCGPALCLRTLSKMWANSNCERSALN